MNRFPSVEVSIGRFRIGGSRPVMIQSMVTAPTLNTEAVVSEVIKLSEAGCPIVRITAATVNEAENLKNIRDELNRRGTDVSLVADIHFLPQAALVAAESMDKVRINPGNYIDWTRYPDSLTLPEFSSDSYYRNPAPEKELNFIKESVRPLAESLKKQGKALRIGVNHGSLSERIMNRFGNSAEGMVVSAIEFTEAFVSLGFDNIVISMKSSNPAVMVEAYRRLAAVMLERRLFFPMHLGVTEAGDGREGRIRSSIGIGSLLLDGIGDTIRVSLTEDSAEEIPAAKALIESLGSRPEEEWSLFLPEFPDETYRLRITSGVILDPADFSAADSLRNKGTDFILFSDRDGAELLYSDNQISVSSLLPLKHYQYLSENESPDHIIIADIRSLDVSLIKWQLDVIAGLIQGDTTRKVPLIVRFDEFSEVSPAGMVKVMRNLKQLVQNREILFSASFSRNTLYSLSAIAGSLFQDRIITGVIADSDKDQQFQDPYRTSSPSDAADLAADILQSVRLRLSKADYISCPGCGRTHFQIMDVTRKIKEKTSHMIGVKIAVMGCIVNGPGEMADADFGYVGAGQGKITLYKGHTPVKRNIPEETAVEELLSLISESGLYKEN